MSSFKLPMRMRILLSVTRRFPVERLCTVLLRTALKLDPSADLQFLYSPERPEYHFPPKRAYAWDAKCRNCYAFTKIFSHSRVAVACWKCESLLCKPTLGKVRCADACFPYNVIDDEVKCRNCFAITKICSPPLQRVECRRCQTILRELIGSLSRITKDCWSHPDGLGCRNCFTITKIHSPELSVVCWQCETVLYESIGGKLHQSEACVSPSEDLSNDIDHFHPEEKSKARVFPPGSFYMEVRCGICGVPTTINGHSRLPIVCWGCQNILCRPTEGKGKVDLVFAVPVKEFSDSRD